MVPHFPPLHFGPAFSGPAFSTPAYWCHIFRSRIFSHSNYITSFASSCAVLTVHSLYRHQLHGTICLHIFVVVPLCRIFYLNSSLSFSLPLSLLGNIIPVHIPCSGLTLFFPFIFYFYLVCYVLSLFNVIMFGFPELWWWGALANLSIWFDLNYGFRWLTGRASD